MAQLCALQSHEPLSGGKSDRTSFMENEEVEDVPGINEVEDNKDRLIHVVHHLLLLKVSTFN